MQPKLLNTIGQSLMAIGLYTVAFESLVLTVKDQMQGYLLKNDPDALKKFYKSLDTSNNTLKFCEPRLLGEGVVDAAELDLLVAIRKRRNMMAHEGYNKTLNLTIKDVEEDVSTMFKIARKVESWRQAGLTPSNTEAIPFMIAPSIFGLYLQAVQLLANTTLAIPPDSRET
ncbi:hypothetical protein [Aeromonas taiwanensis]|uniref:hypothetical protein n=1 Tax=Aeromonas taiwanensis TaxID=633417 RepID=UPI00207CBA29|nr:hypothetical protein [Aeromonas taiwanensis]MCO4206266.1 hypothetical protein [Aeromonas taiwanensis]